MTLTEYIQLNESTYRVNHFTSLLNLAKILKSGHLEAFSYKGDKPSVATVRPSVFDKGNVKGLSMNSIGGIKFAIDVAKLKNTERGIKVKPISEFGKAYKEILDTKKLAFKAKFGFTKKEVEELYKDILNNFSKKKKNIELKDMDYFYNKYKKFKDADKNYLYYSLLEIKKALENYSTKEAALNNREGEERIYSKDNKIYLEPKYMKISFTDLKKIKDYIAYAEAVGKTKPLKDLRKEINKKKEMFVKDDNFKEVMRLLNKIG
jgi:hypothetical protein